MSLNLENLFIKHLFKPQSFLTQISLEFLEQLPVFFTYFQTFSSTQKFRKEHYGPENELII